MTPGEFAEGERLAVAVVTGMRAGARGAVVDALNGASPDALVAAILVMGRMLAVTLDRVPPADAVAALAHWGREVADL